MKSVLISIQPKWCDLIASEKKTVEVRKTRPKMETPFKVYIYCTKGRGDCLWRWNGIWYDTQFPNERPNRLDGKVIGEFVCDFIRREEEVADGLVDLVLERTSCVDARELVKYANGNTLYSWHISDLVIYDKPRELSEFCLPCDHKNDCGTCKRAKYCIDPINSEYRFHNCELENGLKRPPQSWCYVKGGEE